MRRSTAHAIAAISMLPVAAIGSEDTLTEEIVVTASFTGATDSLEKPIHILSGDDVANAGVQSLGEHIDSLLGVSTADFGAAAGQPIIRGLSGTRVKVLNNGTVIRDVSGLGPDHAIDAPLADLQQIEVVRGPSALMYSNGSVGGVINVVDNTIPVTDLEGFSGFLGGEAQSVNDGEAVDFAARGHLGGLNITYSFQEQDLENYEIPNNAVLEMHEDHDGEEHDGEHDEDHDHDEHRDEHGAMDELANSDYESTAHRLGLSTTGDWGYVGVSYTDLSTTYGIPFHGEHASHEGHGDHGDDHDGDHDDDHDDDHDEAHEGEEHHDEHGEERIFAETESETVTFRGSVNTSFGWLNSIDFVVKDTDYELSEGHMEAGHDDEHEGEEHDDHDEHGPTVFSNESTEIQVALDLSAGERVRRLVFNYAEEEMAIIGEEAFMAPVDSTETTLGFFSSDDLGFATLDLGVRFDRIERDGSLAEMHHEEDHDEHEGEHDEDHEGDHDEEHHDDHHEGEMTFEPQSYKEDAFSIAAMLTREINDDSTLSLGLSSVSKVPSAVELFMNGEHLATNRYELGDITLDTERADSIDLTFSFERNSWYGVASVYHNRIDNYIYLRDELEEEHESHMDDDHDEDHHDEGHHDDEHPDHGSLQLAEYTQRDAEFTGYEIEIGTVIELPRGALQLSLSRDEVDAEFNNGEDVPRIVPARNMFSVQYSLDNFSAKLFVKDVEKQTNVAPGESVTDGFTLVDAFASWSYGLTDSSQLTLSAFARNLTDEAARNHASFVKNDVPLPGRNIGVRVQLSF